MAGVRMCACVRWASHLLSAVEHRKAIPYGGMDVAFSFVLCHCMVLYQFGHWWTGRCGLRSICRVCWTVACRIVLSGFFSFL